MFIKSTRMSGTFWKMPDFSATEIADSNEKLRRMGSIYALLSEKVKDVVQHGLVPVSISGDCVSTLGVLGGDGRRPGKNRSAFCGWTLMATSTRGRRLRHNILEECLSLCWWGECSDSRLSPGLLGSSPIRNGKLFCQMGRDLDPGERELSRASQIVRCDIADIFQHLRPHERLYLHWDTDVINAQREMPALKYHVQEGPSISEICSLFKQLMDKNIIAISVSPGTRKRINVTKPHLYA